MVYINFIYISVVINASWLYTHTRTSRILFLNLSTAWTAFFRSAPIKDRLHVGPSWPTYIFFILHLNNISSAPIRTQAHYINRLYNLNNKSDVEK